MSVQTIENFLDKNFFKELQKVIIESDFSWFKRKSMVTNTENNLGYFCHSFFHNNSINSKYFFIVKPILKILNCVVIINIRANLLLKRSEFKSNYHIDRWGFNKPKHKTAIFYVNTNNGHTLFKNNNKKIKCVENKLIIFDSKLSHKAVLQTDKDKRIVINFNYFDSDL